METHHFSGQTCDVVRSDNSKVNASLVAENGRLKERIKHLESILDLDPRTSLSLVNENIQLRDRIKELEAIIEQHGKEGIT